MRPGIERVSGARRTENSDLVASLYANAPAGLPAGASCSRAARAYVPSLHVAMYFTCSGVSVSMVVPMLLSFRRATSLSIAGGTT